MNNGKYCRIGQLTNGRAGPLIVTLYLTCDATECVCGFWSTRILPYFPPSSSVRSSQAWHHKFSLDYDEVDQTDHTFSESISLVLFPRSLCMALSLNVSERVQKSSEVSFCHFLPRLAPSRPLFQKIDASKLKPSRRTCHLEHYPFPRGHLFIFWMMVFYVPLLWICAIIILHLISWLYLTRNISKRRKSVI